MTDAGSPEHRLYSWIRGILLASGSLAALLGIIGSNLVLKRSEAALPFMWFAPFIATLTGVVAVVMPSSCMKWPLKLVILALCAAGWSVAAVNAWAV